MTETPIYLYLHGFASGPASTKARYFAERFRRLGIELKVPDLNGANFEKLTLTSQLRIIGETLAPFPAERATVIIGSSMGGLLATLMSARRPSVRALVLLAPGFGLPRRWTSMLGENGLEQWRHQGFTEVFHYAKNDYARLSYDFILDAQQYVTDGLRVNSPTLVFHGRRDETVPVEESIRFARDNPGLVELNILEDGHELTEPLDQMWGSTLSFLSKHKLITGTGCTARRAKTKIS